MEKDNTAVAQVQVQTVHDSSLVLQATSAKFLVNINAQQIVDINEGNEYLAVGSKLG